MELHHVPRMVLVLVHVERTGLLLRISKRQPSSARPRTQHDPKAWLLQPDASRLDACFQQTSVCPDANMLIKVQVS